MTPTTVDIVVVRPTEAQLRWAQFHHKRRAKGVKLSVERLWKTPLELSDVPDALPEDGNTTTESESVTIARSRPKPKISRGRRAMLRVSKRVYQRRRKAIELNGFQSTKRVNEEDEDDDDDNLDAIFTSESKQRKRSRRHQKHRGDEERLKRFEAACHAMMMNLAAPPKLSIVVPTKIWTRDEDLAASSLDKEYDDLKWGIRRRPRLSEESAGDVHSPNSKLMIPLDRGASWMMHLPKHLPASRDYPYYYEPHGSMASDISNQTGCTSLAEKTPGRHKFDQLVAMAQQQMIARNNPTATNVDGAEPLGTAPKMRLRYLTASAAVDEQGEEKKSPSDTPRRKPHHLSDRFTGASTGSDRKPRERPKLMVGKLKMSCTRCQKVSPVGSVTASDFFASVRHLNVGEPSPIGSRTESDFFSNVRKMNDEAGGQCGEPSPIGSTGTVESDFFSNVRKMNSEDNVQSVEGVCGDCQHCREGNEDGEIYENQVSSSVSPLKSNVHGDDIVRITNEANIAPRRESTQNNSQTDDDDDKSDHSKESTLSVLWNQGRSSMGNVISSTLNAIPESNLQRFATNPVTPIDSSSPANLKARVESVSGRVSGFFSMLSGQQEHDADEFEAVAAFRKSQDERRDSLPPDDGSSSSSYRVLPPGIRSIVKGMYGPQQREHSSARSSTGRSVVSELSPDKYREVHEKLIRNSALLGDGDQEQSIIDTDETTSEASSTGINPKNLSSLLLSPTLLMKRLQQAVQAVEQRNWQKVSYLISANPWLAEMSELTTNQYLLHKLAFYGSGEPTAPEKLNRTLIDLFPSAVHKFDRDGNVPLHLAAATGNLKMVVLLGEKFREGASVRNEDGMLPLHFTIASHNDTDGVAMRQRVDGDEDDNDDTSPVRIIKTVLKLFPKGVAIPDNDGNLPLHIAASCLHGPVGVDVAYMLLDEADRQLQDPYGARFYNKVKIEELDDASVSTMSTQRETDSSLIGDDVIHCNNVRNDMGETPLITAMRARNGWEMIEAIACGPGGKREALYQDGEGNNVLHHLVSAKYENPAAALSILKVTPETASIRNSQGMLPIEAACMHVLPAEVILALVLVDLPFDLDDKDGVKLREGFGGSWSFLTCECDDHYHEIVEEVITICNFQQVRELCFMKIGSASSAGNVLSRATPRSKLALTHALRFVGRFEFVGNSALYGDPSMGLKEFDALDFGGGYEEGRRVLLKCFSIQEPFLKQTAILRDFQLDKTYVEEVLTFAVNADEVQSSEGARQQYCVSIERPNLTVDRVVTGMLKNEAYRRDPATRKKYTGKVCILLRMIAKALRHLHASGIVHGKLCMNNCGKYDDSWKLADTLGMQRIGEKFEPSRWTDSFPPEAVEIASLDDGARVCDSDDAHIAFKHDFEVTTSIDIWAFGKLAYEVIMVEPLVEFDPTKEPADDFSAMMEVMEWDQENLKSVFLKLCDAGVSQDGADLITSCLFPEPENRPTNMGEILSSPFWKEFRRKKDRPRKSNKKEDSIVSVSDV